MREDTAGLHKVGEKETEGTGEQLVIYTKLQY